MMPSLCLCLSTSCGRFYIANNGASFDIRVTHGADAVQGDDRQGNLVLNVAEVRLRICHMAVTYTCAGALCEPCYTWKHPAQPKHFQYPYVFPRYGCAGLSTIALQAR